jgi:prevent-host-death family protein
MKTQSIGAFSAKTHLSELLEQVRQGKAFVITRRGKPVAELRPLSPEAGQLEGLLDLYKGQIKIAKDFDAPLDAFKDYM